MPAAVDDLDRLMRRLELPADTYERVRRSISILHEYPMVGRSLEGQWTGRRLWVGPWRWLIVIYEYDPSRDTVSVLAFQDARAPGAIAGEGS